MQGQDGVPPQDARAIQAWLIDLIAAEAHLDAAAVDVRDNFSVYGLSSVAAIVLTGDLEDWLGIDLAPTLVWDYPTIERLAQFLAGELRRARAPVHGARAAPAAQSATGDAELIARVRALSDDEVVAAIDRKLGAGAEPT